MNSNIWNKAVIVLDKNGMHGTKIYSAPEGEIIHLMLEPGAHLSAHITPVNVVFYVLEGSATLTIGDEVKTFEKDALVESPKDIPHAVTNDADTVLRLLVIKIPKP
ncbi:MAG: cupin domain-containing protein [Candidatus Cloacimonadaceae bacterium]|nr:cupin domain-containing protein [Candidatus Cloacimonadaceae bacterium]MDP3114881.1 cupin domain-containing protein [Candidatus Cloacimonadaceae bacterium]